MSGRYLDVTFRNGKPFAAYLYLSLELGRKCCTSREAAQGMVIDLDTEGQPIGIEITAPSELTLAAINEVMEELRQPVLTPAEFAPLSAA